MLIQEDIGEDLGDEGALVLPAMKRGVVEEEDRKWRGKDGVDEQEEEEEEGPR